MKTSFVHLADVHLGCMQYGLAERFDDFGRAWLDAVRLAIAQQVAFVVIAGDLFEKRNVEPLALMKAQEGLRLLRNAGIPAIAVEGNHDRALYREGYSWMEYLDAQGDLILLDPCSASAPGCHYQRHSRGQGGSYIDIGGVRVVGQPYLGASAPRVLEEMAAHLRLAGQGEAEYVVYACHAGLEGIVARAPGCLTETEFASIRPYADYLALGHIHRQFQRDGWLFNPGSLETCRSDESDFESGFFLVEIDTEASAKHQATLQRPWRRPFVRLVFPVDGHENSADLLGGFHEFLLAEAAARSWADPPVVEIKLTGRLSFDAATMDLSALKEITHSCFGALHVELKNLAQRAGEMEALSDLETRDVIEHRVLQDLFAQDARYQPKAEQWARLAATLKQDVLAGCSAESLVKALSDGADSLGMLPSTRA